jgi:hypothetical protein
VPEPSAPLRNAIVQLGRAINSSLPQVPPLLALTRDVDPEALTRSLRLAQAWAGRVRMGEPVGGDGVAESSVRLAGERRDVVATVALAPAGPYAPKGEPRVRSVTLRPA